MAPCNDSNSEDLKTIASAIHHYFRFECEAEINETYDIVSKHSLNLLKPNNKFSVYCQYVATKVPGFMTWEKFLQFMQIFHIWLEFDKQCDDIASGKGLKKVGIVQNGFQNDNGVGSSSQSSVASEKDEQEVRGSNVYHDLPNGPEEISVQVNDQIEDLEEFDELNEEENEGNDADNNDEDNDDDGNAEYPESEPEFQKESEYHELPAAGEGNVSEPSQSSWEGEIEIQPNTSSKFNVMPKQVPKQFELPSKPPPSLQTETPKNRSFSLGMNHLSDSTNKSRADQSSTTLQTELSPVNRRSFVMSSPDSKNEQTVKKSESINDNQSVIQEKQSDKNEEKAKPRPEIAPKKTIAPTENVNLPDPHNKPTLAGVKPVIKPKIPVTPAGGSIRASVLSAKDKLENTPIQNSSDKPELKKPPIIPNKAKPGKISSPFLESKQSSLFPKKFEKPISPAKTVKPITTIPSAIQNGKKLDQTEASDRQYPKINSAKFEPTFEAATGNNESALNSFEDDKSVSSKGSGESASIKMELENILSKQRPKNICKSTSRDDETEDQNLDDLYSELPSGPENLAPQNDGSNQDAETAPNLKDQPQTKQNFCRLSIMEDDPNDLYHVVPSSQGGLEDGIYDVGNNNVYGRSQDVPSVTPSSRESNCDTLPVYADGEGDNNNDVYDCPLTIPADFPTPAEQQSNSKDGKKGGVIKGMFRNKDKKTSVSKK